MTSDENLVELKDIGYMPLYYVKHKNQLLPKHWWPKIQKHLKIEFVQQVGHGKKGHIHYEPVLCTEEMF